MRCNETIYDYEIPNIVGALFAWILNKVVKLAVDELIKCTQCSGVVDCITCVRCNFNENQTFARTCLCLMWQHLY